MGVAVFGTIRGGLLTQNSIVFLVHTYILRSFVSRLKPILIIVNDPAYIDKIQLLTCAIDVPWSFHDRTPVFSMKTLLISPPLRNMAYHQMRSRGCMPPLNLLYLAASLRARGHAVKIMDLYAKPRPEAEVVDLVGDYAPDAVGFASYTANINEVSVLAAAIKARFPSVMTLVGGIHASYLTAITLADPALDMVVIGEGEETLAELMDALAAGRDPGGVAGLAFKKDGKVVLTPKRPQIPDINTIPWPAWDLVNFIEYYLASTRAVTDRPAFSVMSMRGCAYNCSFCSHSFCYKEVKLRNPADFVDELQFLKENHGIEEFQFEDSTFTCLPDRVREICALIVARGLDITWNCNIRADNMTDDLFAAMSEAGCRRVLMGVEAGTQDILNSMRKGITLDQARRAVTWAKNHGIRVNAAFLIGTPGETLESAWAAYRFALELDTDYAMFSALVPSVGSDLFETAVSAGILKPDQVRGADYITVYSERTPLVTMSGLSRAQLAELMERFTRGFYLRPRYIIKRLAGLRSLNEAAGMLAGFILVLIHQLKTLSPDRSGIYNERL